MVYRSSRWRLDTFLLMGDTFRTQIESAIRAFKKINISSANEMNVWDTFKEYITAVLISVQTYRTKDQNKVRHELLQKILA